MASKIRLAALLLIFGSLTPAFSQTCDCVSTGNCPVPITDNGTYCGVLNVDVDGPNDATPARNDLTQWCSVDNGGGTHQLQY